MNGYRIGSGSIFLVLGLVMALNGVATGGSADALHLPWGKQPGELSGLVYAGERYYQCQAYAADVAAWQFDRLPGMAVDRAEIWFGGSGMCRVLLTGRVYDLDAVARLMSGYTGAEPQDLSGGSPERKVWRWPGAGTDGYLIMTGEPGDYLDLWRQP
ncbi:MAG: hypothetical protein N3A57_01590 [Negativicutes bacterium]|nr:hypothetical protein [Negativicutes bacterium]